MQYIRSLTSFFDNPNWGMNLLYGSLCMLIPVVGPIVLMGYLTELLANHRTTGQAHKGTFDFGRFADYLSHGWQAFVVAMIISLVIMPVMFVIMAIFFIGIALIEDVPILAISVFLLAIILYFTTIIVVILLTIPVMLRAALTQNIGEALRFGPAKEFVGRVGWPMVGAVLFLFVVGTALTIVGYMMCFVGMYPAMALLICAQWHLLGQLHLLYLDRGGTPIPISPALLNDGSTA